jgi:hypothetical protein
MSKRVKIAFAIAFVVLVGAVVWQVAQPCESEPVYEGKRLSVWLNSDTGRGESGEVVRQIGTNAIPTLLRLLRTKDSALKVKLMDLLQRQHIIKIEYTPAETWHFRAAYAFGVLGTNAQTAVPALITIADDNISLNSRVCAIESLGYVGLPTKEAVSALSRWATNADSRVRNWAKTGLLRIGPEAATTADITNSP